MNKKERLKYYYCNYKTNTNLDFEKGTQDSKITVEVDGQEIDPVEYYNVYVEPVTDSKEIESLVIKAEIDLSKSDFLKSLEKSQKPSNISSEIQDNIMINYPNVSNFILNNLLSKFEY